MISAISSSVFLFCYFLVITNTIFSLERKNNIASFEICVGLELLIKFFLHCSCGIFFNKVIIENLPVYYIGIHWQLYK